MVRYPRDRVSPRIFLTGASADIATITLKRRAAASASATAPRRYIVHAVSSAVAASFPSPAAATLEWDTNIATSTSDCLLGCLRTNCNKTLQRATVAIPLSPDSVEAKKGATGHPLTTELTARKYMHLGSTI